MRIVSLVPHATELLFALGLGEHVVGVTHECDWPPETDAIERVTKDRLPKDLSAGEIDAAVRASLEDGEAIYELDEDMVRDLEPDLIVTQALCPVCAVSFDEVTAFAQTMDTCPEVVSLDPKTFGETMGDIRTLAQAVPGTRERALDLVARQRARVDAVKVAVAKRTSTPKVVAIEWFDPVFIGGHWTPQLIELAGGLDLLGMPGEHSGQVGWDVVRACEPDVVVCMPCGYDAPRAHLEATLFGHELARLSGSPQIVAVDASATFSRPGPRLVDGLELLGHLLHPDLVPAPQGVPAPLPVEL